MLWASGMDGNWKIFLNIVYVEPVFPPIMPWYARTEEWLYLAITKSVILPLIGWVKYARRRKLNRYCSRYLERLSFAVPRISKKMPGSILRLSDFGDGSKAHFLMLGFSTPTRQATMTKVLLLCSRNMNWIRRENMVIG